LIDSIHSANGEKCTGKISKTFHADGMLPHLLSISLDDIGEGKYKAKDIPLKLVLPEHHAGLAEEPQNVVYALHTLLHHTGNHFTAHGFIPNGDNGPYVFFHDGMARPLARPAPRNNQNELSYNFKVIRAWYKRVGVAID
jgi:hypothetical protein